MGTLIVKGIASFAIPLMMSVYVWRQGNVSETTMLWACFWELCVVSQLFKN